MSLSVLPTVRDVMNTPRGTQEHRQRKSRDIDNLHADDGYWTQNGGLWAQNGGLWIELRHISVVTSITRWVDTKQMQGFTGASCTVVCREYDVIQQREWNAPHGDDSRHLTLWVWSSYRSVRTSQRTQPASVTKTNQLMRRREIMCVDSGTHAECKKILCGQHIEFVCVTASAVFTFCLWFER
jgi:hypothetical protein